MMMAGCPPTGPVSRADPSTCRTLPGSRLRAAVARAAGRGASGSGYLITGRIKDQIHNQMINTPARHRPSETRLIRSRQALEVSDCDLVICPHPVTIAFPAPVSREHRAFMSGDTTQDR